MRARLALMTIADAHPLTTPRVRNHLAKAFGADAKAIADWGTHWTTEVSRPMNGCLASRAPAPFALGSERGLADICIAGQVVGAQYLKLELALFPPWQVSLNAALPCRRLRRRIRSSSRDTKAGRRGALNGCFQTSRPSTLAALPPAIWASVALVHAVDPRDVSDWVIFGPMSNG